MVKRRMSAKYHASAGNRTRIDCLEGNHANLYTTDADEWLGPTVIPSNYHIFRDLWLKRERNGKLFFLFLNQIICCGITPPPPPKKKNKKKTPKNNNKKANNNPTSIKDHPPKKNNKKKTKKKHKKTTKNKQTNKKQQNKRKQKTKRHMLLNKFHPKTMGKSIVTILRSRI